VKNDEKTALADRPSTTLVCFQGFVGDIAVDDITRARHPMCVLKCSGCDLDPFCNIRCARKQINPYFADSTIV